MKYVITGAAGHPDKLGKTKVEDFATSFAAVYNAS